MNTGKIVFLSSQWGKNNLSFPKNGDSAETAMETEEPGEQQTAEGKTLCSVGMATRIHKLIVKSLIPTLHKILTFKVQILQTEGVLWNTIIRVDFLGAMGTRVPNSI